MAAPYRELRPVVVEPSQNWQRHDAPQRLSAAEDWGILVQREMRPDFPCAQPVGNIATLTVLGRLHHQYVRLLVFGSDGECPVP